MSIIAVDQITDSNGGNTTTVNGATPTIYNTMGRNKIMNGGFDIWQRGTSITGTNNVLGPDRFYVYGYATNSITASQQSALGSIDGFPSFMRLASTSGRVNFWQRIENLKQFNNQTLTLSFYAKSSDVASVDSFVHLGYGSGGSSIDYNTPSSAITTFTLTSSWQKFTHTFTIPDLSSKTFGPDNTSYLEIGLQSASGDIGTLDITGLQLEVGSVATEFERRPYGTELALCQRYYFNAAEHGGGVVNWPSLLVSSGGTYVSHCRFPTTMRTAPTLVSSGMTGTSTCYLNWPGAGSSTLTSVSQRHVSTNTGSITGGQTNSFGGAGYYVHLEISSSFTGTYAWSAEL